MQKRSIDYGIIGLGQFGTSLVNNLVSAGKEVLVIDKDEEKIRHIAETVSHAVVADTLDPSSLRDAGLQNCETVIICFGEVTDGSILTTLNVIELGVPNVIAKAVSPEHGKVLVKIGAQVVFPEKDMGTRLANSLMSSSTLEYFELSNSYSIVEVKVGAKYHNKSIHDLNLRKKYKLNAIAIVKEAEVIVEITPDIVIEERDLLIVVGHNDNIKKFQKANI